ncbi:hypothetical protein DFP93_106119 [Aneurinibacillus soli]|uniref:Uncharacterized protein n=1 Tax=Aneurinibacillus soli TaxID=1500254 RepID=A0A0U5B8N6_9BACL|nr:hypothetical protein [Aneurinibacillus soli]PYE61926.1 hypothetical protein DFP93_106119 [Aneurinibacillus soli]BAU29743.1 hypothetical protein CB4_03980 [Aneurinibacillus soli]
MKLDRKEFEKLKILEDVAREGYVLSSPMSQEEQIELDEVTKRAIEARKAKKKSPNSDS